jgi:hypothetical protein
MKKKLLLALFWGLFGWGVASGAPRDTPAKRMDGDILSLRRQVVLTLGIALAEYEAVEGRDAGKIMIGDRIARLYPAGTARTTVVAGLKRLVGQRGDLSWCELDDEHSKHLHLDVVYPVVSPGVRGRYSLNLGCISFVFDHDDVLVKSYYTESSRTADKTEAVKAEAIIRQREMVSAKK